METKSVALFDCPHCIDNFAFDYEKIRSLAFRWRVMVRCPGCGNVIEVSQPAPARTANTRSRSVGRTKMSKSFVCRSIPV